MHKAYDFSFALEADQQLNKVGVEAVILVMAASLTALAGDRLRGRSGNRRHPEPE